MEPLGMVPKQLWEAQAAGSDNIQSKFKAGPSLNGETLRETQN